MSLENSINKNNKNINYKKIKTAVLHRSWVLDQVRTWFAKENYLEVMSPVYYKYSSGEAHLVPAEVKYFDHKNVNHNGYLRLSPELALKKYLAAGLDKIFEVAPCFRSSEDNNSPNHLFEFTLLEWYNKNISYRELYREVISLILFLAEKKRRSLTTVVEMSVSDAFVKFAHLDLEKTFVTRHSWDFLVEKCLDLGFGNADLFATEKLNNNKKAEHNTQKKNIYSLAALDDAFYLIFLNLIETELRNNYKDAVVVLYDYPEFQGAMARPVADKPGFCERFEVYLGGIELANGYGEICDSQIQSERQKKFSSINSENYGREYDLDRDFIDCLSDIGEASGVALGLERLMMFLLETDNIKDVAALRI